jgi:serine/threonine protein phosphatase PrpC
MQGWRISMEDSHAAILDLHSKYVDKNRKPTDPDKRLAFFGVYDGHGGEQMAVFAGENVHKIVAKQEAFAKGDIEQSLRDGFLATDRAILEGECHACILPRIQRNCFSNQKPRSEIRGRSVRLYSLCRNYLER